MEEVDPEDIPELRSINVEADMPPGPIPHQPWRRGITNGCEDPITANWRVQAEDIIYKSADLVGGKVIDVTWYLTSVVVTLDEDMRKAQDMFKDSGPVIKTRRRRDPVFYDPSDPKPDDLEGDEIQDEFVYVRETPEEAEERKQKKINSYVKKDESDPEDEPHIPEGLEDEEIGLYANEETRADRAIPNILEANALYEEQEIALEGPLPTYDTAALSTIAGAVLEALEEAEPEVKVLSRHEVILAAPGLPDVLETQKQFDAHRGEKVIVETQDPWQSNRVLTGRLLDRNSMDVYIKKQYGEKTRMVTIPNNFVKCVRIEPPDDEGEYEYDIREEEEEA